MLLFQGLVRLSHQALDILVLENELLQDRVNLDHITRLEGKVLIVRDDVLLSEVDCWGSLFLTEKMGLRFLVKVSCDLLAVVCEHVLLSFELDTNRAAKVPQQR